MKLRFWWAWALFCGCGICSGGDLGPVTIGGVSYDHVDPGEPFRESPRPPQDWQPPKPTRPERAAGFIAYVTPDPGDYKPYRIPRPEERVTRLSAFLAQGEYEPVWVGVYGLTDLQGLSLHVDLQGAPLTAEVRYIHCWPQRTGWRSREWYLTPELLLPCREGKKTVPFQRGVLEEQDFNLKAGETAAFWITLHTALAAPPGRYEAVVSIQSRGKPKRVLPLQVELLPFSLRRPEERYWLLYGDAFRWRGMSDSQILAELQDFARHGMTGLVEMPLGRVDLSGLSSGQVRFDAGDFKKLAALCRQAGLPGPHVCSYGGMPDRVREALGLQCGLMKEPWPEELKAGVATMARAAVEATADAPARWYYYGWDEPGGDNTYAIQDYQCWHRGGARTYATFGDLLFLQKASEFLTAPCFVAPLISSPDNAQAAREGCAKAGAAFWWYGTGSYVNPFPQEGFLFHNRYGAGYLFWKTGAQAQVSWTFCRPHEDVFNDFDGAAANSAEPKEQATAYPHFLKPDDWSTYQGAIPTLAWEALREGVDDYTYLHILTTLIQEARESSEKTVRDAAREAEGTVNALVEAIPWVNPLGPAPAEGFDNRHMQQVRRAVADLIVDLQTALAGKPRRPVLMRPGRVALAVQIVEPEPAFSAALPTLLVMPIQVPPQIDGLLEDPCWRDSFLIGPFRYAESGRLATTPTEARIVYDDQALYVAFHCSEPNMDRLVAKQSGHDTSLVWLDDGVEFFLAGSSRDKYAHLIVNTNRSIYDEIGQDPAWNPAVEVGLQKGPDFWNVEMALPWAELERAGIVRSPVMAMNFCRNRFAGAKEAPHTAWSCTYGGFHVPRRFGVALLQEGPVALADLQLPVWWGKSAVEAKLRNLTKASLTAQVGLEGTSMQTVSLPAGAVQEVKLPWDLQKPGLAQATLAWGVVGEPLRRVDLKVPVPPPLSVTGRSWFVSDGDTISMSIVINMAPNERSRYRIRLLLAGRPAPLTVELPVQVGTKKQVKLAVQGSVPLKISLVDENGRPTGPALEGRIFALTR